MAATFGTSGTGNFEGRSASRPAAMRDLVRLEPSPPFWYLHHPARWAYRDGEWLPWLSTLAADPGVSNVDKDGSTDLAEVAKRRRGFVVIPWEAEPGGYVVAYDGVAGTVHLPKWQRPKMVAGQVRFDHDEEGYWAFCRRLLTEGYIEKPDPDFIDVQIERQAKKVAEWREKAPASPFHRDSLAVEEALLANMTSAKERLYAETPADETPAPKARKGRA